MSRLGLSVSIVACQPEANERNFIEPGSSRPYRVVARADHDASRAAAVLFLLHPYATAPDLLVDAFSLRRHGLRDRSLLLVLPEATRDRDGKRAWNATAACCARGASSQDFTYLRDVLAQVKRRYTIDDRRVYALGVSNGAFMAQRWACAGAELRGIVSISGSGPGTADAPCKPRSGVRVLHVHGERDEIIRYGGGTRNGSAYPSIPTLLARWARANHCEDDAALERRWSPLHGWITRHVWRDCQAAVVLWSLEEGYHQLDSLRFSVPELLDFLEPT